ncbi:MAG: hypothetical protein K8R90_09385 [Candidatus Cloacimonetes bacterium]|nr:hypothetical protein [Candidatus Cloacimonadota bacterium]
MPTYRYGNDYAVCLFKEQGSGLGAGYGAYVGDFSSIDKVLPDTCEMKPTIEPLDPKVKTGTNEPRAIQRLAGRTGGTVTLRGSLSQTHEILLQALFSKTATPYEVQETRAPWSYEIHQYFLGDDKGHVATGCVLESFKLEGESAGQITYEATFRARTITSEVNLATGDYVDYGTVELTAAAPFLFGDIAGVSLLGSFDAFTGFEMSLANRFVDDDALYQDSFTKQVELISAFEGEMSFSAVYTAEAGWKEDKLLSAAVTDGAVAFALNDGSVSWTLSAYGKLGEVTPSDPDRQIYMFTGSLSLFGDGTRKAVSIAVA